MVNDEVTRCLLGRRNEVWGKHVSDASVDPNSECNAVKAIYKEISAPSDILVLSREDDRPHAW